MTVTEHSVEPIPARGGLRRLRLGDLEAERSPDHALLPLGRFREALEAEIRRSVLDDQTLVVAALSLRPPPGTGSSAPADLPTEVVTRIRSVNDNITAARQDDDRLLVLIPSIRRRPDGEVVVNQLRQALDDPIRVDGIDHHLAPRIGAAMLDPDSPSSALLVEGAGLALEQCDQLHPP